MRVDPQIRYAAAPSVSGMAFGPNRSSRRLASSLVRPDGTSHAPAVTRIQDQCSIRGVSSVSTDGSSYDRTLLASKPLAQDRGPLRPRSTNGKESSYAEASRLGVRQFRGHRKSFRAKCASRHS